jgi:hypothetical protein
MLLPSMGARRTAALLLVLAGGCGVAVSVVYAAGERGRVEPPCQPSWFVPSVTYKIQGEYVLVDASYQHVWQAGIGSVCRIEPSRPFSYRLRGVGHDGTVLTADPGSFWGDMAPGGSSGGGATVRLKIWCAHQPVSITLNGAGPNDARTGRGYRLVLRGVELRCD